jgi:hypothetical protein
MGRKRTRILKWLGWFLFLMVIQWGVGSVQAQTIGKTIDKSNVQEYKELLYPAMFRAVERGDFILPTGNLNFPYRHWDRFLTASEKNAGKFDVNEMGDLIDKSTGKIPKYNIYGFPFPKIDSKDPRAADKIIWNFNFQKYRFMGIKQNKRALWISGTPGVGEERYVVGPETLLFYQGRPPGQELKNPQNFLTNEFQNIWEPMSMRGTNTLAWDYFDERDITQHSYVPVIRRTRQTSGAARSDPYLGSDGWMDLNYMWSGKNRTMKWKLVGERTILAFFARPTKEIVEEAPDGSLSRKPPFIKWGFMDKSWKGAPWAPLTVTYVPRQVWVIEQWPKDPYYNWGLHINYVDKETHVIFLKEVYDKAGQFRTWNLYPLHYSEAPSGNNTVGMGEATINIDERIRHGTINYTVQYTKDSRIFLPASKRGPDYFTMSNFIQLSK